MYRKTTVLLINILVTATLLFSGCSYTVKQRANTDNENREMNSIKKDMFSEVRKAADPKKMPAAAKNRKDTLVVGIGNPKGRFNPLFSEDMFDAWVTQLVFDGLVSVDEKGNAVPGLASSWDISEDGKTYSFKLREGVKFSDGTELTATDVAFTYTALCDPKYHDIFGGYLRYLAGYMEYSYGNDTEISGIKVEGKYDISFTFRDIKAPVIYDFAIGILPEKHYDFKKGEIYKLNDKMNKPVGSGPYILVDYKEGDSLVFVKNSNYWDGEPNIPNLILKIDSSVNHKKAILEGKIDILTLAANSQNVSSLEMSRFIDLHIYENNGFHYLGLNLRKDMFKDKKVRQALMYGLDRKAFVKGYYGEYGEVCNLPLPRCSWAYPDTINEYEYDKAKAEKMLEDSGWILKEDGWRYDKDEKRFVINWLTYEGSKYVERLIPYVKDSWRQLGIEVIEKVMTFQELKEKVYDEQEFDMYNMSWSLGPDPDPSLIFAAEEDVPGGYNSVGWKNENSEKLLLNALKETDLEKRKNIYMEWAELINEELPYIFLSQSKEICAVNSRVKNIQISSYVDWARNIHRLTLE
jgi:peptide/nickel transport system substrate-binding protein